MPQRRNRRRTALAALLVVLSVLALTLVATGVIGNKDTTPQVCPKVLMKGGCSTPVQKTLPGCVFKIVLEGGATLVSSGPVTLTVTGDDADYTVKFPSKDGTFTAHIHFVTVDKFVAPTGIFMISIQVGGRNYGVSNRVTDVKPSNLKGEDNMFGCTWRLAA